MLASGGFPETTTTHLFTSPPRDFERGAVEWHCALSLLEGVGIVTKNIRPWWVQGCPWPSRVWHLEDWDLLLCWQTVATVRADDVLHFDPLGLFSLVGFLSGRLISFFLVICGWYFNWISYSTSIWHDVPAETVFQVRRMPYGHWPCGRHENTLCLGKKKLMKTWTEPGIEHLGWFSWIAAHLSIELPESIWFSHKDFQIWKSLSSEILRSNTYEQRITENPFQTVW